MHRFCQYILIASTLVGSWLGMQAIHELGHVLAAMLSGGRVARVVLHPVAISRTDFSYNPHPLFVAWSGPIFGILLPLTLYAIAEWRRLPGAFVLRFFAGFCLLANGAYLAFGSIDRVGDAGELIRLGAPVWTLWLLGAVSCPAGLWLWHRQGRYFGLSNPRCEVSCGVAFSSMAVCLLLVVVGLCLGG